MPLSITVPVCSVGLFFAFPGGAFFFRKTLPDDFCLPFFPLDGPLFFLGVSFPLGMPTPLFAVFWRFLVVEKSATLPFCSFFSRAEGYLFGDLAICAFSVFFLRFGWQMFPPTNLPVSRCRPFSLIRLTLPGLLRGGFVLSPSFCDSFFPRSFFLSVCLLLTDSFERSVPPFLFSCSVFRLSWLAYLFFFPPSRVLTFSLPRFGLFPGFVLGGLFFFVESRVFPKHLSSPPATFLVRSSFLVLGRSLLFIPFSWCPTQLLFHTSFF